MTAEENEAVQSPASSSAWSGPSSGGRSIQTFSSETASDPSWHDPVQRLRRWKYRVAHGMSILRQLGQEGMDVIKQQELRARGRYTDLLMNDGSPLPDDLGFWKARYDFFEQEWRQIQAKKPGGLNSIRDSVNPRLDWIQNWVSESRVVGDVDRSDTSRDGGVCQREPLKRPAAMVGQGKGIRKRRRDAAEGEADQDDDNVPSKRPKREPAKLAKMKSHAALSTRAHGGNPRKATASIYVAPNHSHGGDGDGRDKASAGALRTAREPLRRSPRIARSRGAETGHEFL